MACYTPSNPPVAAFIRTINEIIINIWGFIAGRNRRYFPKVLSRRLMYNLSENVPNEVASKTIINLDVMLNRHRF
jgi:hypothetical protein